MSSSKPTASFGGGFGIALGYAMPRLVAKEAEDGSGPIETILRSSPVGPSLRAALGPHLKPLLRLSFPPEDGIDGLQVGGLFIIDFTRICAILLLGPINAGDVESLLRQALLVIEDALNFSGSLH